MPAIIPPMSILGVNHCLPILYKSKRMVHYYTIYETVNQFAIDYMINPSLKFNNAFRTQVEKCLSVSFSASTMKTIKTFLVKNNTCVMVLIIIYENN